MIIYKYYLVWKNHQLFSNNGHAIDHLFIVLSSTIKRLMICFGVSEFCSRVLCKSQEHHKTHITLIVRQLTSRVNVIIMLIRCINVESLFTTIRSAQQHHQNSTHVCVVCRCVGVGLVVVVCVCVCVCVVYVCVYVWVSW